MATRWERQPTRRLQPRWKHLCGIHRASILCVSSNNTSNSPLVVSLSHSTVVLWLSPSPPRPLPPTTTSPLTFACPPLTTAPSHRCWGFPLPPSFAEWHFPPGNSLDPIPQCNRVAKSIQIPLRGSRLWRDRLWRVRRYGSRRRSSAGRRSDSTESVWRGWHKRGERSRRD